MRRLIYFCYRGKVGRWKGAGKGGLSRLKPPIPTFPRRPFPTFILLLCLATGGWTPREGGREGPHIGLFIPPDFLGPLFPCYQSPLSLSSRQGVWQRWLQ